MKRINSLIKWPAICWTILSIIPAFGAGSLTPPGPPGPTMKTLDEIEPRIPISSLPYTISASGSYYLAGNLTGVSGKPGISVMAPNVTIDLRGFALTGVPGAQAGISVDDSVVKNLSVRNGTLRSWQNGVFTAYGGGGGVFEQLRLCDNSASGLFLGPGAIVRDCVSERNGYTGIQVQDGCLIKTCVCRTNRSGILAMNGVTVQDCVVQSNLFCGIMAGTNCLITGCIVDSNGTIGVEVDGGGSTVKGSTVTKNGSGGIYSSGRSVILENTCDSNTGDGIRTDGSGSRIENNQVTQNSGIGIRAMGVTGNLIIRNSAYGNTSSPYSIPAGNNYGQILVSPGAGFTSSAAWANFAY